MYVYLASTQYLTNYIQKSSPVFPETEKSKYLKSVLSFNSGGTRKSNNEGKGVVEFGPQTWSIDLVLVIIERGNLILVVQPPWGARPHPLKSYTLVKWK